MANDSVSLPKDFIVPCCTACNGRFAKVEQDLVGALRDGPDAARKLDRRASAAWAAKVIWGFACLEARIPMEPRDPDGPRILSPADLDLMRPLHDIALTWLVDHPSRQRAGSLHAFHAQHEDGDDVGFLDDPPAGLIALRLRGTALIISATDHRDAEALSREELLTLGHLPVLTDLQSLPLGPIQFRELFARVSTLHRSRPPLPDAGTAFGTFDETVYRDLLDATVGRLPAFRSTGIPWDTTLFEASMKPRFVSLLQTREWGQMILDGARARPS